jgi:hypothetical protein
VRHGLVLPLPEHVSISNSMVQMLGSQHLPFSTILAATSL